MQHRNRQAYVFSKILRGETGSQKAFAEAVAQIFIVKFLQSTSRPHGRLVQFLTEYQQNTFFGSALSDGPFLRQRISVRHHILKRRYGINSEQSQIKSRFTVEFQDFEPEFFLIIGRYNFLKIIDITLVKREFHLLVLKRSGFGESHTFILARKQGKCGGEQPNDGRFHSSRV